MRIYFSEFTLMYSMDTKFYNLNAVVSEVITVDAVSEGVFV